jgi:hypothetical protein
MIPLFTSIPSRFSRILKNGSDVGKTYANDCAESWHKSGFRPFTVNATSEDVTAIAEEMGVEQILLERSSLGIYGKPLIYLSDFLSSACKTTSGPVAITNADILIEIKKEDLSAIEGLTPGSYLAHKRIDIEDPGTRVGIECFQGYDFFVFHTEDLAKIRSTAFTFGMPWWDLFLPTAMRIRGHHPVQISQPSAFHLLHQERWDSKNWIDIGFRFLNEIEVNALDRPDACDYLISARNALEGTDLPRYEKLWTLLRKTTRDGRYQNAVAALKRLAKTTRHLIDQTAPANGIPCDFRSEI